MFRTRLEAKRCLTTFLCLRAAASKTESEFQEKRRKQSCRPNILYIIIYYIELGLSQSNRINVDVNLSLTRLLISFDSILSHASMDPELLNSSNPSRHPFSIPSIFASFVGPGDIYKYVDETPGAHYPSSSH